MKKTRTDLDQDRRAFVKKSTLIGAGVAASTAIPAVAIASPSEIKTEAKQQKGYQLSPHVLAYYKSAAN